MTIDGDAQEDQTPSKAGWYSRSHDNGQKAECYWDGQVWQPTYKRVVQRFPLARPLHISQPPSIPTEHNERFAMPDLPPVADERQQQPPQEKAPRARTIRAPVWRHKLITALAAVVLLVAGGVALAVSHGSSSGSGAGASGGGGNCSVVSSSDGVTVVITGANATAACGVAEADEFSWAQLTSGSWSAGGTASNEVCVDTYQGQVDTYYDPDNSGDASADCQFLSDNAASGEHITYP